MSKWYRFTIRRNLIRYRFLTASEANTLSWAVKAEPVEVGNLDLIAALELIRRQTGLETIEVKP